MRTSEIAVFVCLLFASPAMAAAKPPNIILIMADDIGYECYGCYGSEQYRTPSIDRMAAEGIRFEHCYSQPLCTPSRVKIMTGKSNVRNYSAFSILNADQKTFADYLGKAGYRTLVAGKWQLLGAEHYSKQFRLKGSWPVAMEGDLGFDQSHLWQVDRLGSRFWKPLLRSDRAGSEIVSEKAHHQFGENDYGPDKVVDTIEAFMERKDQPFFIYYPMILVHSPFLPTPHSESRKNKDKQKNFEDMVAYMDHLVGRIVKRAEDLGIAEETLILVTGDNGTHKSLKSKLGDRVIQGGKGLTTDAGTRVALVGYWPGTIKPGTACSDLVDFSDFVPTFQEIAGAPIPDGLDGRSFLPQLKGEKGDPRDWIFCYYNSRPERTEPVRFARDQRWKLYGDGRFYDVPNDVLEQNPITKPEGKEAKAARAKLLEALDSMPAKGQTLLKFDTPESD